MSYARKALHLGTAVALAAAIAPKIGSAVVRWRYREYTKVQAREVPTVMGYGLDFAQGAHQIGEQCTVFRFVNRHCGFCDMEEPLWRSFESAPAHQRCDVVILLPSFGDAPYHASRGEGQEIIWVPLDFAEAINLMVTPTTFVMERGKIVWSRVGGLRPEDLASLISTIERAPLG